MEWTPILSGELGEQALAVARDVAVAMVDRRPANPIEARDFALFWAYACAVFEEERFDERHGQSLDDIAGLLESQALGPALYGGYAGAGWVLHHTAGEDEEDEEDGENDQEGEETAEPAPDVCDDIDAAINGFLDTDEWQGHYDFISGLAGIGAYLLDRLPRPRAVHGMGRIVHHLEEWAERRDDGVAWHTRPELMPEWQRQHRPTGQYDIGVAHGSPGVICLLSALIAAGYDRRWPVVQELLEGAVRFVLGHELGHEDTLFGTIVTPEGEPAGIARNAWCYGDPGVAIALWRAAAVLEDDRVRANSLRIANTAAARDPSQCLIVDAGLCHGRAGLGHLLNRLFHASGDDALRASAVGWFERTLSERRDDDIAGFPMCLPTTNEFEPNATVLEGAPGVALALIAAATDMEPGWDRLLFADLEVAVG